MVNHWPTWQIKRFVVEYWHEAVIWMVHSMETGMYSIAIQTTHTIWITAICVNSVTQLQQKQDLDVGFEAVMKIIYSDYTKLLHWVLIHIWINAQQIKRWNSPTVTQAILTDYFRHIVFPCIILCVCGTNLKWKWPKSAFPSRWRAAAAAAASLWMWVPRPWTCFVFSLLLLWSDVHCNP